MRAQGLRPIQIWVPDVRSPDFAAEAHRQARLVGSSSAAKDDQDSVEAVSEWPALLFRLVVEATSATGLSATSRLMVDKMTTVRRDKLGQRIGELDDADIVRLNRAVVTFLGIAGARQTD